MRMFDEFTLFQGNNMEYPFEPVLASLPVVTPKLAGEMAYWEGLDVNPYLPGTSEHEDWSIGWKFGQQTYHDLTEPEEF